MAHKESGVTDILDILRRAQAGDSIRRIAKATGMDRKTIGNYLRIAAEHGFAAGVAEDQLADIASTVFRTVHAPQLKPSSPTSAAAPLIPHRNLISYWLEKDGLTLTKSHIKLGRMGMVFDPESGRQRVLHALVVTLVFSRHSMCISPTGRIWTP